MNLWILNFVIEWLTLLLRVQEVPGSNLGTETSYPNCFSWFFSVYPGYCWASTIKLCQDHFLPNPFQFIVHLSSSVALQSLYEPWPPHTGSFVILLRNLVGLLWASDQPVAKASIHSRQYKNTKTNIHASSGIRTHDPTNQEAKTYA
jgi:hypothetical protein